MRQKERIEKEKIEPEGSEKYKEVNNIKRCLKKAKENWIGGQCSEIEENLRKNSSKRTYQLERDFTTVKQGKANTVQDRTGKLHTEERQILNRWTEYCSELYNYKTNGDPSVLNCPQTDTEDDHPILRREVEAAVQSLKKGKSAGVDNIPAGLVQAGGEDVITAPHDYINMYCNYAGILHNVLQLCWYATSLISSHLSLNRKGRWGTTDDFATSFFRFSLFSTALWDLPNSRPVHSLMLSSHLFLCLSCLLPLSLCLARWLWPDLMNGIYDHITAVCVSFR